MFEYALKSHQENKRKLDALLAELQAKLSTLNRLAKALRNDIYAVDDEYAESVVYKKIEISKEIEDLEKMQNNLQKLFSTLDMLSIRWKKYLEDKENLPKKKFSSDDDTKITTLRNKEAIKANGTQSKSKKYRALRNSTLKECFIVRYADDFKIFCR